MLQQFAGGQVCEARYSVAALCRQSADGSIQPTTRNVVFMGRDADECSDGRFKFEMDLELNSEYRATSNSVYCEWAHHAAADGLLIPRSECISGGIFNRCCCQSSPPLILSEELNSGDSDGRGSRVKRVEFFRMRFDRALLKSTAVVGRALQTLRSHLEPVQALKFLLPGRVEPPARDPVSRIMAYEFSWKEVPAVTRKSEPAKCLFAADWKGRPATASKSSNSSTRVLVAIPWIEGRHSKYAVRRMASPTVTIEFVVDPTECLANEAIDVFSGLMGADPCSIALTGGDISLLPDFGGVMVRSLMLSPGVSHVYTARDDTGALVGFTIFALPGQLMCSTEEQRDKGRMTEYMGKLSQEGRAYYAETMGKEVPKANDEALGLEAAERNTYWCNLAMVRADYQGKGIAKAMFELAYKEAAKTGATVALTTTNIRNVPIYEKIGLKLYGERKFSSPWVEWTLWFFGREAGKDGRGE